MVNKNRVIFIIFLFFCAIATSSFMLVFHNVSGVAYADDVFTGATVTASVIDRVEGSQAIFRNYSYEYEGYDKNVVSKCTTVEFFLTAPYYSFEYRISEGSTIPLGVEETVDGRAVFIADETGRYVITCIAYSDELGNVESGRKTVEIKNDVTPPTASGNAVEEMSEWLRTGKGREYTATIDWSVYSDVQSGLYRKLYYYLDYADGTQSNVYEVSITNADMSTVTVSKSATLRIVIYDAAGNYLTESYALDKFDDSAPPIPTYVVTPAPEEGTFANKYEIGVHFLPDNGGSGLAPTQHYIVNGESMTFEAGLPDPEKIILETAKNYTITLYAVDNAGNVSEQTDIYIPYSAFDVNPPVIKDVTVSFDLTDPTGICTLSADVSDSSESGVKNVSIKDKGITLGNASASESSVYTAKFDCFGFGNSLTVFAEDNIGNVGSMTIVFPFFSDTEINVAIKNAVEKIRNKDREDFTDEYYKKLDSQNQAICYLLLNGSGAIKSEILSAASDLNALFENTYSTEYLIKYTPDYASTNISFTVEKSDLADYKMGSVVTLEMREGDKVERDYPSMAGFNKGFTDFFALYVKVNGEIVSEPLSEGLSVEMDLPAGYYDRNVALFNASTGEKADFTVVNNTIRFKIKKSTDYALTVEGGKAETGSNKKQETITVFGNSIKKSSFIWVICGCAGGAVLIVAAVVAIMIIKKR